MKNRPFTVTVLAWLLIVTGVVATGFRLMGVSKNIDELWLVLVQLVALVAGLFLLRGQNWRDGLRSLGWPFTWPSACIIPPNSLSCTAFC